MNFLQLGDRKFYKVVLYWDDIAGDSTTVTGEEFEGMECASLVTEGYLYDTFEKNGVTYIRTFSSYELGEKSAYGDRNVYPLSVFTKDSQKHIKKIRAEMDNTDE
tara:strand:+ start:437 stop:751 length:315 start_codon:yes stop_codon:yes gene_type:complete